MAIERYEREDFELYINTETGEVFCSQNALVRMLSDIPVPRTTLRDFGNGRNMGMKRVEAPTNKGFRMVRVYTEDEMLEVFEYFDSPLLKQCAKCGLRVYLHRLAGFQVISTAVQPIPQNSTQDLLLKILAKQEEQDTKLNQVLQKNEELENQLWKALPSSIQYDEIKPALDLGNIEPLMKQVSQNLRDNPTQPYHEISYFLTDKKYTKGQKISMGRDANGYFKVSFAKELPTKYAHKNSKKLYPECAVVIFDYLKQFVS